MLISKNGGSSGRDRIGAVALAVAVGLLGVRSASAVASTYTFTNLGASDLSASVAINNSGEVVGTSGGQAVYSTGGSLAVLGGATAPANSTGLGVNGGGVVVGSYLPTGGSSVVGFYSPTSSSTSTLTSLPATYGGTAGAATTNVANAVNGNNTTYKVVGQATYIGGEVRAFAWSSGSGALTALDPVSGTGAPTNTGLGGGLFGSSAAYGINSTGLIVGQASSSGATNPSHAFLYSPTQSKMYDLGSLGNTTAGAGDSNALAINATGEIVGWTDDVVSSNDYDPRAFIIKSGYAIPSATSSPDQSLFTGPTGMIDIGTLPGGAYSTANAVNASGLVVGFSSIDSTLTDDHAFLYDSAASSPTMVDLNSLVTGLASGWTLDSATGVNDAGQITGYADDGSGNTFAFVLSPGTVVPEPSVGMLLLAGVGAKALGRRRKI